jgi:hypothetical protein
MDRPGRTIAAALLCAAVSRVLEAAANTALTAEYVGVSKDLARPAGLLRDNGVKSVPEIVIYLQGLEGGRIGGRPGRPVEEELAETIQYARWRLAEDMILDYDYFKFTFHEDLPLDCTRCHLAVRPGSRPGRDHGSPSGFGPNTPRASRAFSAAQAFSPSP